MYIHTHRIRGRSALKKKVSHRTIWFQKSKPLKRFRKNLRHLENDCQRSRTLFSRFRRLATKPSLASYSTFFQCGAVMLAYDEKVQVVCRVSCVNGESEKNYLSEQETCVPWYLYALEKNR
jgi:hypothetical protein